MNFWTIVSAAVMLAALWGMVKLNRRIRSAPQLKKWIILCFAAVIAGGGGFLYNTGMLRSWGLDFGWNSRVLNADSAIYASQAAVLEKLLLERGLSGEKRLILCETGQMETAEFQAFHAALAESGEVILAPIEREAGTVLTAALLDKSARKHPECKVVIAATGTPMFDTSRLNCVNAKRSERAQQWILLEPVNDWRSVQWGLTNGNVLGCIRFSESPAGEIAQIPEDPQEVFQLRYQLSTR